MIVLRRLSSGYCAALATTVTALALLPTPLATAAGAGGSTAPTDGAGLATTTVNTISTPTIATAGTPSNPTSTVQTGATATSTPTSSALGPATTPGSKTGARPRASDGKLSAGAILAAIVGGLLALACLVWAALRWGAVEPRWLLPLRHSVAEAGFRASAVWAEFTDWLRLGH